MAINNQDKTEIHNLPEVTTLQPGMMVAVDSEPTGSKSFNLTTALEEKVAAPATAPAEGQVLTFNGSANTWANPPEGVYVLNYSELNNLTDIDLNRAKAQPTYIRIDEECVDVTISVPYNDDSDNPSTYNIVLKVGTLLRLSSILTGNSEFIFTTVYNAAFYAGSMGSYGTFFPVLYIRSNDGYLYKTFKVTGELSSGSLNMGMPTAFTKFYRNSRGNGSVASDRNALELQFQWNGNIRKQCLLPGEVSTHNFANDETPEQIQFMGWGAKSNRAGYKNLITAQHTYDSTNFPLQTPQVQFMKTKMSGGTPGSDQVMDIVQASMKSSDGQSTTTIGGILVPSISSAGVLQNWSDSNGGHYGWKPVNEVPSSTASDSGKVLSVDSNGIAGWGNAVGFVKNAGALTDAATITVSNLNNGFATLSTSQAVLTIIDVVGTDEIVNFAIEITPSVNCTLTVQKKIGSDTPVTLKHSVAAGNALEAGKTYQVTAVGNCWTLAEFEA
jgi:hypothetical protein